MGWATGSGWQGTAVVPGTLTVGDSVVVSSATQSGSAAFQAGNFDFNVGAAYGSSTATAPVYGAGVMGNIIGSALTATQNILAGVIGKYDVTTSNASVLGKAGVIGQVGNQANSADAAVLALLGGDTGTTTPGAAFGVMSMNSTAASQFGFGLDLYRAAVGSYQPVAYSTAAIRVPNAAWIMGRNAADSANVNMFRIDTSNLIAAGVALNASTTVAGGSGTGTATLVGVLSANTTAVGNVGSGEDDLMSYSLPANTLGANNKGIRITAWFSTAGDNETKTLTFYFGTGSTVMYSASALNNAPLMITIIILRTASNDQVGFYNRYNGQTDAYSGGTLEALAETDTAAINIRFTGTAVSNPADNAIVQRGMVVEMLN